MCDRLIGETLLMARHRPVGCRCGWERAMSGMGPFDIEARYGSPIVSAQPPPCASGLRHAASVSGGNASVD